MFPALSDFDPDPPFPFPIPFGVLDSVDLDDLDTSDLEDFVSADLEDLLLLVLILLLALADLSDLEDFGPALFSDLPFTDLDSDFGILDPLATFRSLTFDLFSAKDEAKRERDTMMIELWIHFIVQFCVLNC